MRTITVALHKLRSSRDLRAEILSLAVKLSLDPACRAVLVVAEPLLSAESVMREWAKAAPALSLAIRDRIHVQVESKRPKGRGGSLPTSPLIELGRPNIVFEVLRLLAGAALECGHQPHGGDISSQISGTQAGLARVTGRSPTAVRDALLSLEKFRIIPSPRWLDVDLKALAGHSLVDIGAAPQRVSFRIRNRTGRRSAEVRREIAATLMTKLPNELEFLSLSGTAAAMIDVPSLSWSFEERVDLLAHIPRSIKFLREDTLRAIHPDILPTQDYCPDSDLVITLTRTDARFDRKISDGGIRIAHPGDIFLSLMDQGINKQALEYAEAIKRRLA